MPWQSSGGGGGSGGPWGGGSDNNGPWGGGGRESGGGSPWGRGSGGGSGGGGGGGFGGGRPPDLEGMIRKGQDSIKRMVPGGFGGGRALLLVAVVLLALWFASGIYRVNQGEQGVVLRFGEWVNQATLAEPGLHYHLPYPIETHITPQVEQVRQIDVGFRRRGAVSSRAQTSADVPEESLMLTGDQNIIDIDFTVQWRIVNAGQFLFNIRDPEATIKLAAESAMREIVGRTDILPIISTEKEVVAARTRETLQRILDEYEAGVAITAVTMQDVQPPTQVADSFEDVQRARQDLDTKKNQADAYSNKVIPEARGEARRIIEGAEAYREQVINEAEGEAERFLQVYEAYKQNPDVTRRRLYLETVQRVMESTNKVILDLGSEGNQSSLPIIPLDRLVTPRQ